MTGVRSIVLIAVFLPAIAAAEERCPWLNAATAGGILGGAAHVTVTATSCEFVRLYAGHETALRIEVGPMSAPHAQCGSNAVPLRAIGNEAMACTYIGKEGSTSEQVVGRVRDLILLVRISTNDREATSKILREKARLMAEQVAGILF